MTKIDIYSGFLGAGKTTLIKKLISDCYKGEKLVLIENEFGEIGIDGGFLQDSGIEIKEINPLGSNRNQIDKIFRRKSIRVGDINYFLERDFLGSGYGRLSAVSADGTRTVLYDVSAQHLIQGIITIVFLVLAFGIGGIIVVRSHMRKHQLRGE